MRIKFKKYGSNTAFGSFAPGDLLSTSDEMAAHLVAAGIAAYHDAPSAAQVARGEPSGPEAVQTTPEPKKMALRGRKSRRDE